MKKIRRDKIKEGRNKVCAVISSTQREEEIQRGVEAFRQDRENEDLLLV